MKNIYKLFKMSSFHFDSGLQALREVVDDLLQYFNGDFIPCLDKSPF